MTRFNTPRIRFGARAGQNDDVADDGLPTPKRIRLKTRRMAAITEAKAVLESLPQPGESVHTICAARMDLSDIIGALLERLGRCDRMMVATLGYNRKNLKTILGWLDQGAVASFALVASMFFRSHNGELWTETLTEFRFRSQRAACCDSHAKVVAMHFATGAKMAIEGSANLCGNGSGREQVAKRKHLYARAVGAGEIRTALACLDSETALLRLYDPPIRPSKPSPVKDRKTHLVESIAFWTTVVESSTSLAQRMSARERLDKLLGLELLDIEDRVKTLEDALEKKNGDMTA